MHLSPSSPAPRELAQESLQADVVVIGGGLAGTCAAITAARAGAKVVLVQDRPVLGGNASSEVRLWALGASAHLKNNNRWARESGVLGEITAENLYRNRFGNPVFFDALLLDFVVAEPNLRLLLNTALDGVEMAAPDTISAISAFCSQSSIRYSIRGTQFVDASGDGLLGFLAGAEFRIGAEKTEEFGESLAPSPEYGHLLGQSIFFTTKRHDRPVRYVRPAFAYSREELLARSPKIGKHLTANSQGVGFYWVEYGGRLDTIKDTEAIKWELWRFLYGVWDHIKNSGQFPDTENLTLEWMGSIPGKRESRRFAGDTWLTQNDVLEQRPHTDAIGFGGWSIDLHHADGMYSKTLSTCEQWYAEGVYPVPYRTLYSRSHRNLLLAGRIISASHVAFGTTRVMATCGYLGQAAGLAAALCIRDGLAPRDYASGEPLRRLQNALHRTGQHIPGIPWIEPVNLAHQATITASSTLILDHLPDNGPRHVLAYDYAQLIPLSVGPAPCVSFTVDVAEATSLTLQLRISRKAANHSPQVVLGERLLALEAGADQLVTLDFPVQIAEATYGFYTLLRNPQVTLHTSAQLITGLACVEHRADQTSAGYARNVLKPDEKPGDKLFELWYPQRRPTPWAPVGLPNAAFRIAPSLAAFGTDNLLNGWLRPTTAPNAWVADPTDPAPGLTLKWETPQTIHAVDLWFDCDYDHPAETITKAHPEEIVPFQVVSASLHDEQGLEIGRLDNHHQARATFTFATPLTTRRLELRDLRTADGKTPAAVFAVFVR
jgi:hypothetical protein